MAVFMPGFYIPHFTNNSLLMDVGYTADRLAEFLIQLYLHLDKNSLMSRATCMAMT